MTSSTNPFQIIDDDDEGFDWEAAVQEIDIACQATASATAATTSDPQLSHNCKTTLGETDKKSGSGSCSKQSTLDKFMIRACPEENPCTVVNGQQHNTNTSNGGVDDVRPSCLAIDTDAAKSWIYPVNVPRRDYQFSITKTALFSNTLVALPTGLGKTLIAAVVMYNYFRWFPQGKIVFAAPSRPLVMQQIEACHNIVGIPQEWTIDMTGQMNPTRRASFWKEKRVFFVTPQVLEKDIQSGTCMVKQLVCLVIDEAHRAMGNYSYCVIVRELMAVSVQLRILALSATPGTNRKTIQQIIDNLSISILEYREESDDDVSKFVHNRKIELIQVAMGQDAVDCDNMLLELISPYAGRLRSLGLLHNRDLRNMSPPELLSMREKFRQAPPDICHFKNADVEGHFGLLITLCHIRKLLSSHGVKPAYEMLEEKLQQGSFARFMSRNEVMQKLKLLMQKSLSNGAFTPKLSKMLEVLSGHFSTKDPKCSRVIIFSNFRGSVREIMDALVNSGGHVKATEFIGQSSGKSLKGQSQKVQQAVLEKFRSGGYNVIVATSIGEEGLDIMEVDLVICFDANISSLRMIQRMGRTGRKNDGRVVVLACEGSELNGYLKKQASGKVVKKHMRNGGLQSFTFYPSPRMVPHIFKPEAQFVKLSIEEYVPRTKKVKDHHSFQTPNVAEKLTDSEAHLLAKYFKPNVDNTWKPSLIAFPHFQAYPSRVHRVMHSLRTRILIDAVQSLQEISPCGVKTFTEDQVLSSPCLKEAHGYNTEGSPRSNESLKQDFERGVSDSDLIIVSTIYANDEHKISKSQGQSSLDHCHLFSSKFVSVDSQGKVQILSVPIIPDKQTSKCRSSEAAKKLPANFLDQSFSPGTPKLKNEFSDEADTVEEIVREVLSFNVKDTELSPRLTSFIKSGVVPESPIDGHGLLSPEKYFGTPKSTSQSEKNGLVLETTTTAREASNSPVEEVNTHLVQKSNCNGRNASIAEETCILSANMEPQSCSKDLCLNSGDKITSDENPRKLKRLCRHGDVCERTIRNNVKESSNLHKRTQVMSYSGPSLITDNHSRDKQEPDFNVRDFIEEEAGVSSGAILSDDEKLQEESSSYESSFIDDRINLTAPGTQAEVGSIDMMGIYRRSLLSQSPIVRSISPEPAAPRNRSTKTGSFLDKPVSSLRTLEAESGSTRDTANSVSYTSSRARPISVNLSSEESNGLENRKRKVGCTQLYSVPAVNLEERFIASSEAERGLSVNSHAEKIEGNGKVRSKQSFMGGQNENMAMDGEMCDNDSFFEGLDLDAVEAQATMLLKNKLQVSVQREESIYETIPKYNLIDCPSFDLGI